ncbi:potassium transporter TrkA, partial [Streptomyces venezuelae]
PLPPPHPAPLPRTPRDPPPAAPACAGAMLGRQVLGAVPVERRVLLFAAVDVADHPLLDGRTVREAFHAGKWRVIALDGSAGTTGRESWRLDPDRTLKPSDRVVVAATRRGLAELLGRGARTPTADGD